MKQILSILAPIVLASSALAADPIVVTGATSATANLPRLAGVENIEVFHADRAKPLFNERVGWTYNHHVDLAAWKGRLYVGWNTCEKDEDTWPSRELFATST